MSDDIQHVISGWMASPKHSKRYTNKFVLSSQVEANMIWNAVNHLVGKSPEPVNMNNSHGEVEQPPVVESRHNLNISQFEQLLLSPVVEFHSVPAISDISDRQYDGFS